MVDDEIIWIWFYYIEWSLQATFNPRGININSIKFFHLEICIKMSSFLVCLQMWWYLKTFWTRHPDITQSTEEVRLRIKFSPWLFYINMVLCDNDMEGKLVIRFSKINCILKTESEQNGYTFWILNIESLTFYKLFCDQTIGSLSLFSWNVVLWECDVRILVQ